MQNNFLKNGANGFSLIEVLIAMAIMVFIIIAIYLFMGNVADTSLRISNSLLAQQEINQTLQALVPELRSAGQSNSGIYPIIEAATSSIRFYSDTDGDGIFEEIHYFLEGDVFKRGIIEPSGNPLVYNPSDEKVRELVENMIVSNQIFSYYSGQATSTEATALSFPINISEVAKVKISLSANQGTEVNLSVVKVEDLVTIRNLRFKN